MKKIDAIIKPFKLDDVREALAGPGARFTWWGEDGNGDAFLTAWAWYADWQAS